MKRPAALISSCVLAVSSFHVTGFAALPSSIGDVLVERSPDDDKVRSLLHEHSPRFLEGSPGRDLPMEMSYATFRFEIWPKAAERCAAFEKDAAIELPTDELLAVAADDKETPRAREMAVWLLASRLTKKEEQGRAFSVLQLPLIGSEGRPGLGDALASFLQSSDRATRFSAVTVVAGHGALDSADALVQAIKRPFLAERAAACRAIGRFGMDGLGADGLSLLRPLIYANPDYSITPAAMHGLLLIGTVEYEKNGDTAAIDELIKALRYAPRAGAPLDRKDFGGWGTTGREYVTGVSEEDIASGARSDAFIRSSAAWSLCFLDVYELQRHALEPMLKALGDEEISVVESAFRFFDRVGVSAADWNAAPVIESLVRAPDPLLSTRAAWVFAHWGERAREYVPLLIEQIDARLGKNGDIFFYVWALGNSGDARAAEYLNRLRGRVGPDTRPLDHEGNIVSNDGHLLKLIDEGLVRIRCTRDLRAGSDAAAQDKALTEAMKLPRRRYLTPTLLEVMEDDSRSEALRVRCATIVLELDPVAAPIWFSRSLKARPDIPASLKAVLESERPARTPD